MNDCAAIHDLVARSVVTERPNLALQTAPDGTVTILFSDIVSSTEINAHVGDARWMELLHEHNEIVRREKAFHRGYEVKTIGDAFMLAFQSARDAVHCAIAIQRAFAARNKAAKPRIALRIGLHLRELVREADDFLDNMLTTQPAWRRRLARARFSFRLYCVKWSNHRESSLLGHEGHKL
jgi:eukaryotic-like serine/threonine-protein kinase